MWNNLHKRICSVAHMIIIECATIVHVKYAQSKNDLHPYQRQMVNIIRITYSCFESC